MVPALEKGLQLSNMLGKRSLLLGVSTTTARPPPQKKKKERKKNLVSASETPRGVSRGRSSLVSELRLQRTLNCTAAWSGLWTVAGEISAKDPPTCVGVRAPWEASGGQLQD